MQEKGDDERESQGILYAAAKDLKEELLIAIS